MLLGINIDGRLTFTDHISSCCNKTARQLNALSRISKYLDLKGRKPIFKSFAMSNFIYCPIVWHFCGKKNYSKVENIPRMCTAHILWWLQFQIYWALKGTRDHHHTTITIHCIILEVFNSMQGINPACIQNMSEIWKFTYSKWNSPKIVQPKHNSSTFGLKSFVYFGNKLWNDLLSHFKETTDSITFKCVSVAALVWFWP